MKSFLNDIISDVKDDHFCLASDRTQSAEFAGWVDTGCYIFNGFLSASLYGGMPDNKITVLAGAPSTGKTFLALGVIKHFLARDEKASVIYFDTEAAVTTEMMIDRDIDPDRVAISEAETIEDFRFRALKCLAVYDKLPDSKKGPLLLVLDSLGGLSSEKELADTAKGENKTDMTPAKAIRATFRVLTLKLSQLQVPLLVTQHTYSPLSQYAAQVVAGGGGLQYAASQVVMLTKAKDKDEKEGVVGNFITATMVKSRLTRENARVIMKLSYKTGLDPYYGLLALAEKYDIIKKGARQYELSDGRKVFGKFIDEHPEEVFTKDIMAQLEVAAQKEFSYGAEGTPEAAEESDENGEAA